MKKRVITVSCFIIVLFVLTLAPCLRAEDSVFPPPPSKEQTFAGWFNALGEKETENLFKEAEQLFVQEKYEKAALIFGRLAKASPTKSKEAHLRVVECHCRRGDGPRARQWAEAATVRFPDCAKGWTLLGQANGLVGRLQEQIDAFEKSLAIYPNDPEVHFQLCLAYDKLDKPNKMVEHAQSAVRLDGSYKKRLSPLIKNSNVARRIGQIITDVLQQSKGSQLTDEQIDEYARRVGEILGDENIRKPGATKSSKKK